MNRNALTGSGGLPSLRGQRPAAPDLSGAILGRLDQRRLFVSTRRRAWLGLGRVAGGGCLCALAVGLAGVQAQRWTESLREERARTLGPLVRSAADRAGASLARVAEVGTPGESWLVASLPFSLPPEPSPAPGSLAAPAPAGAGVHGHAPARPWTWEPAVRAVAQLPQSPAASSLVDGYLRRRDRTPVLGAHDWSATPAARFIRALSVPAPRSRAEPWSTGACYASPGESPR